jgi:G3E family GTPase
MVTVVDGFNFLHDYSSQDYIADRGESLGEEDQRTVVNLLVEQVEFCDVIVLNKTDLLSPEDVSRLEAILHTLNPRADIVHARFGQIPLERILNTNRFDFEQAADAPGWLQELRGEHIPETEEYGISSFVYHARRPFHPARFHQWINQEWPGVIRSKGYFWLASRPGLVGSWSQAGPVTRHELGGLWWVAVPQEEWPQDEDNRRIILERWVEPYGDAQQELVMIGIEMDKAALRQAFDACLLNDAELAAGPEAWVRYEDPFPQWAIDEDEEE